MGVAMRGDFEQQLEELQKPRPGGSPPTALPGGSSAGGSSGQWEGGVTARLPQAADPTPLRLSN